MSQFHQINLVSRPWSWGCILFCDPYSYSCWTLSVYRPPSKNLSSLCCIWNLPDCCWCRIFSLCWVQAATGWKAIKSNGQLHWCNIRRDLDSTVVGLGVNRSRYSQSNGGWRGEDGQSSSVMERALASKNEKPHTCWIRVASSDSRNRWRCCQRVQACEMRARYWRHEGIEGQGESRDRAGLY